MNRILLFGAVVAMAVALPARAQTLDDPSEWVPWSGPPGGYVVPRDAAPPPAPAAQPAAEPRFEDATPVEDLEAADDVDPGEPDPDLAEPDDADAAQWNVAATESQWAAQPPPPPLPDSVDPQAAAPELVPPATQPTQHDFEATLSQYGTWVNEPGLGWVWQPSAAVVGTDFVPYVTNGSWSYCSSGWGFQSQWSWGWAPFHYGRWYQHARYGWVWWPSYTWGPAWVDWRYGGGYAAWAPLPPPGISLGFGVRSPGWSFAPWRSLHRPYVSRYVIRPQYGAAWGNRNGWGWTRGSSRVHGAVGIGAGVARHSDGLGSASTRGWSTPRSSGFGVSRGSSWGSHPSGGFSSGARGFSGGSRGFSSGGSHGFSGGGSHGFSGGGAHGFSGGHSGGGFRGGGGGHHR